MIYQLSHHLQAFEGFEESSVQNRHNTVVMTRLDGKEKLWESSVFLRVRYASAGHT